MMTNGICKKKIQMKDIRSSSENTMDYCSTAEEDYFESINSPTDNSEDSVEVKISPITIRNKRKCAEPRKVQEKFTGPLKKRMCLKVKAEVSNLISDNSIQTNSDKNHQTISDNSHQINSDNSHQINSNNSHQTSGDNTHSTNSDNSHPFRPWSPKSQTKDVKIEMNSLPSPSSVTITTTNNSVKSFVMPSIPVQVVSTNYYGSTKLIVGNGYFRPPSPPPSSPSLSVIKSTDLDKAVALIKRSSQIDDVIVKVEKFDDGAPLSPPAHLQRVPIHPPINKLSTIETERIISNTNEIFPSLNENSNGKSEQQSNRHQRNGNGEQRNYKNMTRERRIEANARERTRVHTISAAFDTLRKSIPAYSHNQKLSKLSVLRIACSYIMTLSNIVSDNEKSTTEYVEMVTKTIQREGKLRKKKDDND